MSQDDRDSDRIFPFGTEKIHLFQTECLKKCPPVRSWILEAVFASFISDAVFKMHLSLRPTLLWRKNKTASNPAGVPTILNPKPTHTFVRTLRSRFFFFFFRDKVETQFDQGQHTGLHGKMSCFIRLSQHKNDSRIPTTFV